MITKIEDPKLSAMPIETKTIFDEAGNKLGEAEYVNGQLHGICRFWSPSGQLIQESHFFSGEYHGPYKSWWDNGHKKEEGQYLSGKRIGFYPWYTLEGKLWKEHSYPDMY
jgi:antitoxin component YwqK of YwqJK toxin-antitoxin module